MTTFRLVALIAALIVGLALGAGPAHARPCRDCPVQDEGAGVGVGPPAGITVTGTFSYSDTAGPRPIAAAKVEVWRFSPGAAGVWTWRPERTVTTDAAGRIATSFPFDSQGVIYALRVFATNYAAVVWPNGAAHTVPFHAEPGAPAAPIHRTVTGGGQTLDFSWTFADGWTPQHYNLAETVRRGFDFATARRHPGETDVIPPVPVQPTSVVGSWFNPPVDTVVINSSSVFQDLIVLHEYAHFLEEQLGSFPWIASVHNGCTAIDGVFRHNINTAEHAWMEGFADWFAQAVVLRDPAAGLVGSASTTGEVATSLATLESPGCGALPAGVTGDEVENLVAGVLWDLTDTANEPGDGLGGQDLAIFQIMDRELDVAPHAGPWPSINGMRSAWRLRGLDGAGLDAILTLNGVPIPVDVRPSGTAGDPEPVDPDSRLCQVRPWLCEPGGRG